MDAAAAKKRKLDEIGSHDNGVCLLYLQPNNNVLLSLCNCQCR